MPTAPMSFDVLPPNLHKHVDPASPKPLRGMAAKALVPMSPSQLCTALCLLSYDPEQDIATQARTTAAGLPDRILAVALRDTAIEPQALDFFADVLADKDAYLEFICVNSTARDETVAKVAGHGSAAICEAISRNQLRLLRYEPLLRALLENSNASGATVDSVADFAVRSGVELTDVPALVAARIRVFGVAEVAAEGPSADEVAESFQVKEEEQPPMEEQKKLTFTQQVLKMNVSQKIKLAILGNKEARTMLLRDGNKLVAMAAIQSPRITESEVFGQAGNKTCNADVLGYIYNSREWLKSYQIRFALVKNPKVPLGIAMKFMMLLQEGDIRDLSRSKNVPGTIQTQAKQILLKRETKGSKH